MASQQFYALEGKLRRTVYAIVFQDMITNVTTLQEEDVKVLLKGIKSAIGDATEKSMEFLVENEIIEIIPKKRKKKKAR